MRLPENSAGSLKRGSLLLLLLLLLPFRGARKPRFDPSKTQPAFSWFFFGS